MTDAAGPFTIEVVDSRSEEATGLIRALSAELARLYDFADDGSGGFDPADASGPGGAFLVGRAGGRAVACGAFRRLDAGVAEVKRMYVEPASRGHGYSRLLLAELERLAWVAGYDVIRLETGVRQPEALRLYESAGYRRIGNFGAYHGDERSVCFEKSRSDVPRS